MIDGHMHLEYGALTKEYVLEFVAEAKRKNIEHIQILDHTHRFIEFKEMYEPLRGIPIQDKWLQTKTKFCNHLDEFIQLMKEIKAMNLGIKISYGLEVCYTPEYEDFIRSILQQYEFDFIVGAIHSIDGILYDMTFSKELLWEKEDVNHIYKRYYELSFQLIKSNLFTQFAHPDTIKLFNYYPTYNLQDTYDSLALLLNKHHVYAENNTGCYYRYNHQDMGLSDDLLATLKKHHVKMMPCSDAHKPQDVGSYIKDIYDKTMF